MTEIPIPHRCIVQFTGDERKEPEAMNQERERQLDRRHIEKGCAKFNDMNITYGVVYANDRAYKVSVNLHGKWEARRDRRFDNKKQSK